VSVAILTDRCLLIVIVLLLPDTSDKQRRGQTITNVQNQADGHVCRSTFVQYWLVAMPVQHKYTEGALKGRKGSAATWLQRVRRLRMCTISNASPTEGVTQISAASYHHEPESQGVGLSKGVT